MARVNIHLILIIVSQEEITKCWEWLWMAKVRSWRIPGKPHKLMTETQWLRDLLADQQNGLPADLKARPHLPHWIADWKVNTYNCLTLEDRIVHRTGYLKQFQCPTPHCHKTPSYDHNYEFSLLHLQTLLAFIMLCQHFRPISLGNDGPSKTGLQKSRPWRPGRKSGAKKMDLQWKRMRLDHLEQDHIRQYLSKADSKRPPLAGLNWGVWVVVAGMPLVRALPRAFEITPQKQFISKGERKDSIFVKAVPLLWTRLEGFPWVGWGEIRRWETTPPSWGTEALNAGF